MQDHDDHRLICSDLLGRQAPDFHADKKKLELEQG
jgi:hypothetical protein